MSTTPIPGGSYWINSPMAKPYTYKVCPGPAIDGHNRIAVIENPGSTGLFVPIGDLIPFDEPAEVRVNAYNTVAAGWVVSGPGRAWDLDARAVESLRLRRDSTGNWTVEKEVR